MRSLPAGAIGDVMHMRTARFRPRAHHVEKVGVVVFALRKEQVLRVHLLELLQQAPGFAVPQVVDHEPGLGVLRTSQARHGAVRRRQCGQFGHVHIGEKAGVRIDPDEHVDIGAAGRIEDRIALVGEPDGVPAVRRPALAQWQGDRQRADAQPAPWQHRAAGARVVGVAGLEGDQLRAASHQVAGDDAAGCDRRLEAFVVQQQRNLRRPVREIGLEHGAPVIAIACRMAGGHDGKAARPGGRCHPILQTAPRVQRRAPSSASMMWPTSSSPCAALRLTRTRLTPAGVAGGIIRLV